MLAVTIGTGTVAAFFFLSFELIVFPMLYYSTTTLAAVLVNRRAKKGVSIFVKPMRFPLWSEGLMPSNKANVGLLLIRIIFIIIPVYLESQLKSQRSTVTENIPIAYLPAPLNNISHLDPILDSNYCRQMKANSTMVFYRCARFDSEGWLVASIANVTLLDGKINSIKCILQSERRIFRKTPLPGTETNIYFQTFNYSTALYVDRDDLPVYFSHIFIYQRNAKNRTKEIECFAGGSFVFSLTPRSSSSSVRGTLSFRSLYCQEKMDKYVSFFWMYGCDVEGISESDAKKLNNWQDMEIGQTRMTSISGHFNCEKLLIATVQFKDGILFTPLNIMIAWETDLFHFERDPYIQFIHETATFLYTKAENHSLKLEGDKFDKTEISNRILIIGGIEIFAITLFTILMVYVSSCTSMVSQKPNTLNGLSKIWVTSEAVEKSYFEGENLKEIRLRMLPDEEKPDLHKWMPVPQVVEKIMNRNLNRSRHKMPQNVVQRKG